MDPDTTLAEMRAAINSGDYVRAGELAEILDGWLTAGGFLPAPWSRKRDEFYARASVTLRGPCGCEAGTRERV